MKNYAPNTMVVPWTVYMIQGLLWIALCFAVVSFVLVISALSFIIPILAPYLIDEVSLSSITAMISPNC